VDAIRIQFATDTEAREYLHREGWYHETKNTYYQHYTIAGMGNVARYGTLVQHDGFVEFVMAAQVSRRRT
jgi:hypothetical protein